MEIFINRDGQQMGPYSLDDVMTYLKEGTLVPTDLAWYEGAADWMPLSNVPGVPTRQSSPPPPPPPPPPLTRQTSLDQTRIGTTYKDYEEVPWHRRSGWNSAFLLVGFLIFPPLLWMSCVFVLTGEIYYKKKDAQGILKTWPRGNRAGAIFLIVMQALLIYGRLNK